MTIEGKGLCNSSWLHAYSDPLIAILMNPAHASFANPKLWEAIGEGKFINDGLKCGFTKLTTIKEIPLPELTLERKIEIGLLCAKLFCKNANWNFWANCWLNNEDRSHESAQLAQEQIDDDGLKWHCAWSIATAAFWYGLHIKVSHRRIDVDVGDCVAASIHNASKLADAIQLTNIINIIKGK